MVFFRPHIDPRSPPYVNPINPITRRRVFSISHWSFPSASTSSLNRSMSITCLSVFSRSF